jgi:hypothetical protein
MCASKRSPPEFSTQRLPLGTPHVGHWTEDICFLVSSFFFIQKYCHKCKHRSVRFGTLSTEPLPAIKGGTARSVFMRLDFYSRHSKRCSLYVCRRGDMPKPALCGVSSRAENGCEAKYHKQPEEIQTYLLFLSFEV